MILFLGRIHRIKGIDMLLMAYANLAKQLDDVRLVIAGPDYGFLSTLKRQTVDLGLADQILFTGSLYGQDKLEAYIDADVYVLPSIYDVLGISVLEAYACGTPAIVTYTCGCAEWIRSKKCGYVIRYGDVGDLTGRLKHMLENPEQREHMANRGRKFISENLTWDRLVRDIERIYEDMQS